MASNKEEVYTDRITELYRGKSILVTGGTGFLGKVFFEKILRECPDIKCIYLLIRNKKGKDPQTRLKEMFALQIFDKIKSIHGNDILIKKCKAIIGDVSEVNLGISEQDRKILTENIDYIYHCAATVRFDEHLKSALMLNTRGTKYMLELAKECKQLKLFCHVSTAYVCPKEKVLDEKIYPAPADPHQTIAALEYMSSDLVDTCTEKILDGLPNTYTFTKALGEALVGEQMDNLPIIITRPSVVVPIWKEPLPGWCENINGPVGLMIGAGKGVIRSMYCNSSYFADFISVDIAANALALCSWDYLTHRERRIYNLTSSDEIQVSWRELIDLGRNIVEKKMPFNNVPWYPGGDVKSSRLAHNLSVFFFQQVPAVLVDILLFCLGYKPVLCRIQKRIIKGYELLEHYANNQWLFLKKNAATARQLMNPLELQKYKVDIKGLNIEDYFTDVFHGARVHILKETDDTLPAAKRHMKIMWCVDKLFKFLFVIGMLNLLYKYILVPVLGL